MKTYNLEDSEQKSLSQEIGDTLGFCEGYDIRTLIDNNKYPFIAEYFSLQIARKETDSNIEIDLRGNGVEEMSFAYFFQWLWDEITNGRKISEIGLMEAFLCGIRACSRFPKYPILYYTLCIYLMKRYDTDKVDISLFDEIYNRIVEENSGVSFKVQECGKDFDIIKAIKVIVGK